MLGTPGVEFWPTADRQILDIFVLLEEIDEGRMDESAEKAYPADNSTDILNLDAVYAAAH